MAIIRLIFFLFFILIWPIIGLATEWKIVPDKSKIAFKATQNNSPVTGEFKKFSGDIFFNKNALNKSHVRVIVDTASLSTSYKDVSDVLKTADWFDIKAYPTAIFTANNFKQTHDNTYEANGKLTLRDKTLPLTIIFSLEKYTDHEAVVSGYANLKRTAFDIGKGEWKSTAEIKDNVEITFKVEATKP